MGAQLYHYVSERPGHVSGLVNASNQLVNRYEYKAFGEGITTTEQVAQPLRFGAREYDLETKLYFNRARYYDAHLGRFISQDPIGLQAGINPYIYGDNDPLRVRDPSGLDGDRERLVCPDGYVIVDIGVEPDGTPYIDCERRSGGPAVQCAFCGSYEFTPGAKDRGPTSLLVFAADPFDGLIRPIPCPPTIRFDRVRHSGQLFFSSDFDRRGFVGGGTNIADYVGRSDFVSGNGRWKWYGPEGIVTCNEERRETRNVLAITITRWETIYQFIWLGGVVLPYRPPWRPQ